MATTPAMRPVFRPPPAPRPPGAPGLRPPGPPGLRPPGPRPFYQQPHTQSRFPMHPSARFGAPRPENSAMNIAHGITFDGKRLRKSVQRKTIDYNTTVIKYLQNRIWQRDIIDRRAIQPDCLYHSELLPPNSLLDKPVNCVLTKFMRQATNKFKCPIFSLCWTPEGRRLVTGASSGEFTLWNGLAFNFETILQAHDCAVRAMEWSHNNTWMITADHNGFIKYWQSNMNNVKMFQAHKDPIRDLSFCPSDSKFTTCSDDGTVRVWDFIHCHEERILRGHGADVKCVAWHPHMSLIVSGSKDAQQPIKLWDPKSGQSLSTIHSHKNTVMDLEWNQNGNWLLTASRDHTCKLFDIRNMKEEVETYRGHKKEVSCVAWNPIHENMFASGGSDGAILYWLTGNDKEIGAMDNAHDGLIWTMRWHPMGEVLATGSNDHSTKFWSRNRPGDFMKDKYNLNLLPHGVTEELSESLEHQQSGNVASIPGMGLEHGMTDQGDDLKTKKSRPFPGFQSGDGMRKAPLTRAIPKQFQRAWEGGIQPPLMPPPKDVSRQPEGKKGLLGFAVPMRPPFGFQEHLPEHELRMKMPGGVGRKSLLGDPMMSAYNPLGPPLGTNNIQDPYLHQADPNFEQEDNYSNGNAIEKFIEPVGFGAGSRGGRGGLQDGAVGGGRSEEGSRGGRTALLPSPSNDGEKAVPLVPPSPLGFPLLSAQAQMAGSTGGPQDSSGLKRSWEQGPGQDPRNRGRGRHTRSGRAFGGRMGDRL